MRKFLTTTESIPQSLHQPRPQAISLSDLAQKLGVEQKRLLPLLEHGYVKLVSPNPPFVLEPPPAAIEWLKLMFMPLIMRPFLTTEMVADLEMMAPVDVRKLCLSYDIPLHSDPVFGELMSASSFYRFHNQLHHYREPSRFDRQAMIVALMQAVDPLRFKYDLRPPRYSKRLEAEIKRIARLPEPQRTEMALRLCDAFGDAKKASDILAAARGKPPADFPEMRKAEKIVAVADE